MSFVYTIHFDLYISLSALSMCIYQATDTIIQFVAHVSLSTLSYACVYPIRVMYIFIYNLHLLCTFRVYYLHIYICLLSTIYYLCLQLIYVSLSTLSRVRLSKLCALLLTVVCVFISFLSSLSCVCVFFLFTFSVSVFFPVCLHPFVCLFASLFLFLGLFVSVCLYFSLIIFSLSDYSFMIPVIPFFICLCFFFLSFLLVYFLSLYRFVVGCLSLSIYLSIWYIYLHLPHLCVSSVIYLDLIFF